VTTDLEQRLELALRERDDARRRVIEAENQSANKSETIRWYQVLTRTSDPVMLRNRLAAADALSLDNDPKQRREPKP